MPATAAQVLAKLKKVAPHIAISTTWSPDPHFRWDGDGPDPADEGYLAHNVDVWAKTIVDGRVVEGRDSIGGAYAKHGEWDPEVNGYFLGLLGHALHDLWEQLKDKDVEIDREIDAGKDLVERAARIRYEEERTPRRKQDWSPRWKKPWLL